MTDREPEDIAVRREVVNPRHSYVVSAPAGSGKTALLTQRVLNLLSTVNKPEEILAITFTRKAAAEMQTRIFSYLVKAEAIRSGKTVLSDLPPYEQTLAESALQALERSYALDWDLLNNPSRLSVSTIDGFCKSICSQLPFFSGLGSQVSILSNAFSEYDFVTRRWLLDELKTETNTKLRLLVDHFSGNLERIVSMFSALLGVRDQWLPLVALGRHDDSFESEGVHSEVIRSYFESTLKDWVSESIETLLAKIGHYEGELLSLFAYAFQNKDGAKNASLIETLNGFDHFPIEEDGAEQFWREFSRFCLTKDKYRSRIDKNLGFPAFKDKESNDLCKAHKQRIIQIFSEFEEIGVSAADLFALQHLPDTQYEDSQWQVLEAMTACLPSLVAYLKLRFSELSSADFVEFSLASVHALDQDMGDVSLMQRLDYQIQHILIDEFQDTSQTQLNLLKALTIEWMPNDGKTLFLVGDGMQSCYGFRNANVGIFLRMREQGLPNIDLRSRNLTVNFRSHKPIIDWVNTVFSSAFPQYNDINSGAVKYIPSIPFHDQYDSADAQINAAVHCNAFDKNSTHEAEDIANKILELKNQYPNDEIAILARSRPHLFQVIAALKKYEIDYLANELDPILSKQHVVDIDAVARFLFNPNDKLAYLALLRSPFCGLNHHDLFKVFNAVNQKEKPTLKELVDAVSVQKELGKNGMHRFMRFQRTLSATFNTVGRRSFSECIEVLWIALGGPESLSEDSEKSDIETYLSLLIEHENAGRILNWENFQADLQREYAAAASYSSSPVQVMTMHKSKGLEFDSVFLPNLDRRKRNDDEDVLYWLEKLDSELDRRFVLSPIDAKHSATQNRITSYIKSQRSEKTEFEHMRILYVACTRAKKRLYLSANFQVDENGELKSADKSSYIGKIWTHVGDSMSTVENQGTSIAKHEDAVKNPSQNGIFALPAEWDNQLGDLPEKTVTQPFDNRGYNFADEWQSLRSGSRLKGIAIHKVFQWAATIGLPAFLGAGSNRVYAFIGTQLELQGVSKRDLDTYVEDIATHVLNLRENESLRWILSDTHRDARNEWPLWSKVAGSLTQNVIDRSFVEDGVRWIIDYKSAELEAGDSLSAFFESQLIEHKDQLLRYRDAVNQFERQNPSGRRSDVIKVALFFSSIGAFKHYEEFDLTLNIH